MESESDRDLRFRLDWPEDQGDVSTPESDFSFDWEEQRDDPPPLDVGDGEAGFEEELAEELAGEPPVDPFAGIPEPVSVLDDEIDLAATGEVYEVPFYTDAEALESVRGVLAEHNGALVQLSEAVFELATNVRQLLEEMRESARGDRGESGESSGVAASAMVTMTAAVEQLGDDLKAARQDMQGMMDDVVAASGGQSVGGKKNEPRVFVELERLRSELQALKRRLPVRAREIDADDIVDRVTEAVVAALGESTAAPRPAAQPVRTAKRDAKRQRPLRAD